MTKTVKTAWRSSRWDMSRSLMRSVAYSQKRKSVGPTEVEAAHTERRSQNWPTDCDVPAHSKTNRTSGTTKGLHTVETVRATSRKTRRVRDGRLAARIATKRSSPVRFDGSGDAISRWSTAGSAMRPRNG